MDRKWVTLWVASIFLACVTFLLSEDVKRGIFLLPFAAGLVFFITNTSGFKSYISGAIKIYFIVAIIISIIGVHQRVVIIPPDAVGYADDGVEILEAIAGGNIDAIKNSINRYTFSISLYNIFNGIVFSVLGRSIYSMSVINSCFTSIGIVYFFRTYRIWWGKDAGYIVTLLVFVYPSLYWVGPANLREPGSFMLISIFFYILSHWLENGNLNVLHALLVVLLASLFRYYNLPLLLMVSFLCLLLVLVMSNAKAYRYKYKLPAFLVLIFIGYTFYAFNFIDVFRIRRIATSSQRAAVGGETFTNPLTQDALSNWFILLEYLLSTIRYYLTPLIWNVSSGGFVFSLYHYASSIYYVTSLVLTTICVPYSFNQKKYLSLMLIFFAILFFGSYGVADVRIGSAVRHKFQFFIFTHLLICKPRNVKFELR